MINRFNDTALSTDFWWLLPEEASQYRYIDLFHQEPYSDEPETDKEPLSCPILPSEIRHRLEDIGEWRVKFRNTNIFRSYALYNSDTTGEGIIGPLLLDIDRTIEQDGGYLLDLDSALKDTRLLVKEYCLNLKGEDYRIFFTGHKGFHIEIHPRAISMPPKLDRWQHFEHQRKKINSLFGDAFVDKLHSHVRLHSSINSWIGYSGHQVYFMNFEMSVDELFTHGIKDISIKAQKLALE